eukprot:CAMPEP_0177772710 /NCGR_PEP_ID=MMETSP0491_2-20121128/12418_1 /TAXON_ID=63592 /ORGANISM="Tetraselmis chuii, Strain PLY429" /LENGTH=64 /DNA_ID=CAMNT_0019290639 /DNA_START=471 /DNA_END=661 /DNA_ORIENTATION=+
MGMCGEFGVIMKIVSTQLLYQLSGSRVVSTTLASGYFASCSRQKGELGKSVVALYTCLPRLNTS